VQVRLVDDIQAGGAERLLQAPSNGCGDRHICPFYSQPTVLSSQVRRGYSSRATDSTDRARAIR
jgi:hypothetical protein